MAVPLLPRPRRQRLHGSNGVQTSPQTPLLGAFNEVVASRFVREDAGQDLIEYGLLIAIITTAAITAISGIGLKVAGYFSTLNSQLPNCGAEEDGYPTNGEAVRLARAPRQFFQACDPVHKRFENIPHDRLVL